MRQVDPAAGGRRSPASGLGHVSVLGEPAAAARTNREIGFVFQDAALLPWRTALQNVSLPLEVGGGAARRGTRTPQELLALVGLAGWEDAYPHELSGGMRQRVAIARALVCGPKLLLMDEPFGALDEITRDRLNEELLDVWTSTGVTIMFVTHSIYEAAFLGQQVLLLAARPGRVRELVPSICRRRAAFRHSRDRRVRQTRRLSPHRPGELLMTATVDNAVTDPGLDADRAAMEAHLAQRRRLKWRRRLLPALAVACLLVLWWQAVERLGVKPFIAPSPVSVVMVFVTRLHMMLVNLAPTAVEAVLGFLLGNSIAVLVATVFVLRKTVEEAFYPVALMVNTIPVVASAPILVLLLGNGIAPKIAISALICFFPTLVNMTRGFRDVNPQALELMRVLSAGDWEVFFKLRRQECPAVPVLGLAHHRLDLGDRRHRRRMDRHQCRHRRADHPGHLQFRFGAALRQRRDGLGPGAAVLRADQFRRRPDHQMERGARALTACRARRSEERQ